jgi:hypothetical protein
VILGLHVPENYDLEGKLYKFLSNVTEIRNCVIIRESPAIRDLRFFSVSEQTQLVAKLKTPTTLATR